MKPYNKIIVVFDYIKTPEQHYYAADTLFDHNNTGENATLISNSLQIALISKNSTIVRNPQALMQNLEKVLVEDKKKKTIG
ncbi:hypothetical protein [Sporosarcina highlanderae]|uniref:Uncharacterized protein n=1 Tax=Sporosarcina highlanderae TaxID=3035916 RepID=A0ABT8JLE6_9BACL|nr:hypothetical protein [Sporosarcina highlanderae]MDN4605899.1 hypothetical protein [Sporosarcina highlanderae]